MLRVRIRLQTVIHGARREAASELGRERVSIRTKPRPGFPPLLLLRSMRYLRQRILNLQDLERPKEWSQIYHVVRG
jgi:hypothetical protein